jgi:transposase
MARTARALSLTDEQRRLLRSIVNRRTAPQREVIRARIILNRAEGLSQLETAVAVRVNRPVVGKWEARFRAHGLAGLVDTPRPGRPCSLSAGIKKAIIAEATRPPANRTRWSIRTMAKARGVSKTTVQKLWHANEIKPHLTRTFKSSNDPEFDAKFWDVIGLYLAPPNKALVICCDEKSQCQALERTQPGLPLGVGHIKTKTHDYIRHGTLTLFAALNYAEGKIFSQLAIGHTHKEWLKFLKQIDREAPADLTLHLIVANYATHKHPAVRSWIAWRNARYAKSNEGRERMVLHFTPTSSSWMNMVERFFRDLTEDALREGSFSGIGELAEAILNYLAAHNENPKRYVWKAEGEKILAKIRRAREILAETHSE